MTLKKTTRRIAASGAVAAIAAIGFAGAAQAVSTSSCTATPYTPTYSYTNSSGVKVLLYKIKVTCSANRTATVEQYRMEEDTFSDDEIGHSTHVRSFTSAGTQYINFYGTLPDTEIGMEEMYHKIRLRVSSNGVTSPWTGWQSSGVQAFYN